MFGFEVVMVVVVGESIFFRGVNDLCIPGVVFETPSPPIFTPPPPLFLLLRVFLLGGLFHLQTQSVTILPHRLRCTVTASPDAANAHITHFGSHDSGIRVVCTEITRSFLNN